MFQLILQVHFRQDKNKNYEVLRSTKKA